MKRNKEGLWDPVKKPLLWVIGLTVGIGVLGFLSPGTSMMGYGLIGFIGMLFISYYGGKNAAENFGCTKGEIVKVGGIVWITSVAIDMGLLTLLSYAYSVPMPLPGFLMGTVFRLAVMEFLFLKGGGESIFSLNLE